MTQENKEMYLSLLRNILTILGGYLLGKSVLGVNVTGEVWQIVMGSIFTVIGIVMSIMDKSVNIEKVQGAIRHIVSTLGGVFVGSGLIEPDRMEMWAGFALSLVPVVMGYLSRKKVQQVQSGEVQIHQLKGADATTNTLK